ncbi:MAG: 50S ribosomal protein L11 methyltransferase [Polyangiales bacterium]
MSDEPTRYATLTVDCSPEQVDVLLGRLTLLGAEGIEQRDPTTLTKGGALGATLIACFGTEAEAQEALRALDGGVEAVVAVVEGDAWRDAWKEHWQPAHLTDRVVVIPSWTTYALAPGEIALSMDPGRAFGTGQHASTRLAARALERHLAARSEPLLIDLGCGSGILSFVALLHGVPRAIACDIDDESVVSVVENAGPLGLLPRLDARVGGFEVVPERAALVVANIEAVVLVPEAPAVAEKVLPGGRLILSGILCTQRDEVVRRYESLGFTFDRAEVEGDWTAPEFLRP